MKIFIPTLSLLLLTTSANAVKTPPPTPSPAASTPVANSFSTSPVDTLLTEDLIRTLRDPFQAPSIFVTKKDKPASDLETFQLKDLKLNGVITGPKKVKAMLTAPNGKGYFVVVGEKIGVREGRVTSIQAESIKVVEYEIDERGKKVPEILEMRLNGDVVSLSKKEE